MKITVFLFVIMCICNVGSVFSQTKTLTLTEVNLISIDSITGFDYYILPCMNIDNQDTLVVLTAKLNLNLATEVDHIKGLTKLRTNTTYYLFLDKVEIIKFGHGNFRVSNSEFTIDDILIINDDDIVFSSPNLVDLYYRRRW